MHGMINRALEGFARDTYGDALWLSVLDELAFDSESFDAVMSRDKDLTGALLNALAHSLRKQNEEVLEDLGTFLVASPKMNPLRRLLRFGGEDFEEFLGSLNELPARARMAMPDLDVPTLALIEAEDEGLSLRVSGTTLLPKGFGHVMLGLLRAMADDYGALVFLEHRVASDGAEHIRIKLLEASFAKARDFALGERAR